MVEKPVQSPYKIPYGQEIIQRRNATLAFYKKRRQLWRQLAKKKQSHTKRHVLAIATAIFLILIVMFNRAIVGIITALALIAFALLPALLKRKMEGQMPMGPEFNTFGTIIMGIAFGPIAGAAFGTIMLIIAATVERGFSPGLPVSLLISIATGLLARTAYDYLGIVWGGMALLAAATILGNGFTMMVQRDAEITTIGVIGSIMNFAINYVVLLYLGVPLIKILI